MAIDPSLRGRSIEWVGSSQKEIRDMPEEVRREFGQALYEAELGGRHPSAKPLKGIEDIEVVSDFSGDTFRAVYTIKFAGILYVLGAFQKKSTFKSKTPKVDIDRIKRRLAAAREHFEMYHKSRETG
ncbi:type II toxin-antitoxin system RelE/ParE family toxin [Methylobacterium sp. E-045]|uniref:type II toxin-antitoxin system RelE/ParE family toxin n=1 Tax=Methylobacterium sp. E-045 TaxID=2836575 RepID=UPI001FB8C553|nr:type II toxin-antitoxin system RelE/ParE family toxin [Methylobacterium sp. E-045]MCJ2129263.1 type II toxin-antitoxin system RelE/ParE family toxin [Methylobacterium sp. E-045]